MQAAPPAAGYWDALESLDADLVASQFAERGSFQLASAAPLTGRAAIRRAFLHLFIDLENIERHPVTSWSGDGLFVNDSDLTLTFSDGARLTIPATTVLWTRDREILNCRLLSDPEPRLRRYFE
jgi:hypothetical protein